MIFHTDPFAEETEIAGHPLAHLSVSVHVKDHSTPSDMDIFVTVRHYDAEGKEGNLKSPHFPYLSLSCAERLSDDSLLHRNHR